MKIPKVPKITVGVSDMMNFSQMLSCVKFEIVGICIKHTWHGIKIGIKIRVWRPELLVETVKNPGDSVMPFVGTITSKIAQQGLRTLIGQTITSGSQSIRDVNLQFNEVHVYDNPLKNILAIFFGGLWCYGGYSPWGSWGFFKYFSEVDALEWRFGVLESILHLPQILLNISCLSPINPPSICMRYWGPIYPRTGFLTHHSEVVGSAGDVFRAVSNAWIGSFNHFKIVPLWWRATTSDKIQMIFPRWSGCIKIGTNPALWEAGRTSPTGKYLWIYWRRITCCIF